jgi:hypothetical protein
MNFSVRPHIFMENHGLGKLGTKDENRIFCVVIVFKDMRSIQDK